MAEQRLSDFIRTHRDEIVSAWAGHVRLLAPARELSERAVINHMPEIIARIADIVESVHTGRTVSLEHVPSEHAVDRLHRGFDLDQLVTEYGLLRRSILDHWEARVGPSINLAELRSLDAAFDDSLAQSAKRYAQAREKLLRALDRVSEAALGSDDIEHFLEGLLRATLLGTEAVDSCIVLLREGDVLRVRAAVGLEEEIGRSYALHIGEGFAGKVAQERRPLALRHASEDPLVDSPVIRASGMRALFGVPMMREGRVIGVAHIGSLHAFEFSEEDQLLFRTVVSRATAGVVKAQILADLRWAEASQRFLSEASRAFARSLDFEATLARIAHLAVPTVADWAIVDLREAEAVRRVSVAHADPAKSSLIESLARLYPADLSAESAIAQVLRTGLPQWRAEVTAADLAAVASDAQHLDLLRTLDVASYIVVPILVEGEVAGSIALVTGSARRRYEEADVRLAEDLADLAAVALVNARLYGAAQQAIAAREQVLAVVSHDLRNQLATIAGAANLLARMIDRMDATNIQRAGERIRRTVDSMRHLLDDLLDMAAIQAGRVSLDPQPVVVAALLEEAFEAHEAAAHAIGVDLRFTPLDDTVRVLADRERIVQVLGNLLGNALKFTPAGGVITLAAEVDVSQVTISVVDTGAGIAEADLATIFEPFRVGERRAGTGTGLGLYIVNGIVARHGGKVWATTEIGKGSTFYLTLPRV